MINKKLLLIITAIIIAFTGCGDNKRTTTTTSVIKEKPGLPVKVFNVKKESTSISKSYPGLITPYEEADVTARVKGILEKKHFKEGSLVKKGDLLYTIEQDTYKANLDQAQANFNKANKDYKRAKALLKSKAISIQDYDNYQYSYEDAKANLTEAKIQYSYTKVTSPINGIAGIKHSDIGDLVGSDSSNTLLVTITAIDPINVEFSLSKEDIKEFLPQIREGKATISILNNDKEYKNGIIDYIAPKLDSQTDTLFLRAKFDNKNKELLVGEFVQIQLGNLNIPDVFIIPEVALLKTAKGNFVYVVKDNQAKITPVEVGSLLSQGIIIKSGLNPNDNVIISNIAKVRPDTKVQIIDGTK
jgi:membrane fusion protein (multidrug efflux system)